MNTVKLIFLVILSGLMVACSQTPKSEEPQRFIGPDESFCIQQGGEYIDGAYPACRLPSGKELNSWNFYQDNSHRYWDK